jgi:hypothetical protein
MLRLVIGSVISKSQTAFVKNGQILDGVLIANEVVDEARRSKKELLLFKVDFKKVMIRWTRLLGQCYGEDVLPSSVEKVDQRVCGHDHCVCSS